MSEIGYHNVKDGEEIDEEDLRNDDLINLKLESDIGMEDLAPEGGWGWIVAVSLIVIYVTVIGPSSSYGLIFGQFLESTGQSGLIMMLFGAAFNLTFCVTSSLVNPLIKKYTIEYVGIAGGFMFSLSNILLAIAIDFYCMLVIFLLQGIGVGIIFSISNTIFNAYFVKKRTRIMSLAQVIVGMGAIGYPYVIDKIMPLYGFRGTLAMIGAISLHCIPAMMTMHPVGWHPKDRKTMRDLTAARNLAMSNEQSIIDTHQKKSVSSAKWTSLPGLQDNNSQEISLLINSSKTENTEMNPDNVDLTDTEATRVRSRSWSTQEALTNRFYLFPTSSFTNVATSIGTLENIKSNPNLLGNNIIEKIEPKNDTSLYRKFFNIFDLSMMKDAYFMNLCIGVSIALNVDYTFTSLLPLMMVKYGYTVSESALAVMVGGIAELFFRIFLAIFSFFVKVRAKYLFFIGMIAMSFVKTGFLVYESTLTGVLVMNAIIGMVHTLMLVPQPLVIVEGVRIENLVSAYGSFGFTSGLISLVIGPVLGLVRDWSNSDRVLQYTLLAINTIFIFPWALQFIIIDFREWSKRPRKVDVSASLNNYKQK